MLPILDNSFKTISQNLKILFTDLDDTLTTDGKLPKDAYSALWDLSESGIDIVIVTGRPAGWCDLIARLWPVKAVIGENGAFVFSVVNNKIKRKYYLDSSERDLQFKNIIDELKKKVPKAKVSTDQNYREYDLAIDFAEEVKELPKSDVSQICSTMSKFGLNPKISSIHVNGLPLGISKIIACGLFIKEEYNKSIEEMLDSIIFLGDSPNDEPMFEKFTYSCGVANINKFLDIIKYLPSYISEQEGGKGFFEISNRIIELRST